jgi:pyruvate/2-oxoglutarate dehydrogenase complex dihydrolipoamide acyltransferase (E2) component
MAAVLKAQTRMGRATVASLGIHVLVALSIPALAWTASSGAPVETVSFTRIVHIELSRPHRPQPPPRAAAPHKSVAPVVNFNHVELAHTAPSRQAPPQRAAATEAPVAPAVASQQQAGQGSAPNADVQTTPSPEIRAVASVGTHQTGGYLPFGAEQPDPVLDPDVRKQLDTFGVHVTLVVTVGEDGRTQSVDFQPPVDAAIEARIRSLLADASWDPAVCGGGVSCQGQAIIKL